MNKAILDGIRANDHRVISRVISQIENDFAYPAEFFSELHSQGQSSLRIGVTGPPGAGKSTIVDQLVTNLVDNGKSVGVVAVDPNSPFTGGALLGDRLRMNHFIWDDSVFIRSMGSGGDLGGLARKTQDVGDVLAASGKDIVVFETVGVGQGEHDVVKAVDLVLVVLVPESGDEIQMMKAGLIEIANIYVINKSDRDGAGRLAHLLRNIIHTGLAPDETAPPVINTVASTGKGIKELLAEIENQVERRKRNNGFFKKRQMHQQDRVISLVQEVLTRKFWSKARLTELRKLTDVSNGMEKSPHKLAEDFIKQYG